MRDGGLFDACIRRSFVCWLTMPEISLSRRSTTNRKKTNKLPSETWRNILSKGGASGGVGSNEFRATEYRTVRLLRGTIVNRTCGVHKNLYI